MPHPVQRSACDRCHDQKLRCTRASSGGACVRCTKAKASCTWTPVSIRRPRESKRSVANTPVAPLNATVAGTMTPITCSPGGVEYPNGIMNGIVAVDPAQTTAAAFDLGLEVFHSAPTVWSDSTFLNSATHASSSPSFTVSGDSTTLATRDQLSPKAPPTPTGDTMNTWQYRFNQEWAMLSSDRQQLSPRRDSSLSYSPKLSGSSNLPLDTIRRLTDLHVELFTLSSKVPKPPTCLSQPLSWKDKDVAIDGTFQLSYAFIEAIDKLDSRHESAASLAGANGVTLDQASLLLVFSCYQRLIETYDDIFGNMQVCLDRSSITAPEDYVQMPDVKVGSFSLPDSSALQITLILQLARHLIQRIGLMVMDLNNTTTDAPIDDLTSITLHTLNTRQNELIERINTLRNTLVSLNIL
ncbi:hypothetical protein GGS21DRAFT_16077 [Xylaria nigripes]|nr:hypothetical protein GGS21DRAFT_16077 [Xylaria nigripes]